MNLFKTGQYLSVSILVAVAITFFFYFFFTPITLDDYMFMAIWKDINGTENFSFAGLLKFYEYIRNTDNGRIANLLAPFASLFSPFKQLTPFLSGLLVAVNVYFAKIMATTQKGALGALFYSLIWVSFILFLPWYNSLSVADYTLNYIWSSAINLAFLYVLFWREKAGWTPGWMSIAIVLSFLAGGWHESFAVSSICGIFLYIILRRPKLTSQFYFISFLFILFTLLFAVSPGIIGRTQSSTGTFYLKSISPRYYLITLILILYLISLALTSAGRKLIRETLKSPVFLVGSGIIISGYFIGYVTVNWPRCYFWANEASIILLFYCFSKSSLCKKICSINSVNMGGAIVISLICIGEMITVCFWSWKYRNENDRIIAKIEESVSGIAEYDITLPVISPKYTLNMPLAGIWEDQWQYRVLSWNYKKPFLSLVPIGIMEVEYENAEIMGGNHQIKKWGKFLISPYDGMDPYQNLNIPGSVGIAYKNNDGLKMEEKILASPFISAEYLHSDNVKRPDTLLYYRLPVDKVDNIVYIDSVYKLPIAAFPYMYRKAYEE